MIIRLLGDVEVAHGDGWRRAGPAKQACALAILAMSPGTAVSQEILIHRIWGPRGPESARNSLYVYINGLRRLLREHPAVSITRGTDGYRLDATPAAIDWFQLRELAARAQRLREDDAVACLATYRQAMDLWSPNPLHGIGGDWARHTREALERERRRILEERFEAELDAGHHEEIIEELTALTEAEPQAEHLVGQLMLALHRAGRRSDALAVFTRIEHTLRASFGLDPTPELRAMRQRVSRNDAAPESSGTVPDAPPVPRQLPLMVGDLVGRDDSIARLDATLSQAAGSNITVITGMPGIGKSTLAVRWGHRVAEEFPDGQLFVQLRGSSPEHRRNSADVLAGFLLALGVPGAQVPADFDERLAMYRTHTAGRRLLVMLDDASAAEQVRPLLPAGPACTVVVTSRYSLPGLVAAEGVSRVDLNVLTIDESVSLLGGFLPGAASEVLRGIAESCGRLPLALRIAGANVASSQNATGFLEEMRTGDSLTSLEVDGVPDMAVRHAFTSSYRALTPEARRAFRLLGTIPTVDIGVSAAAAFLDVTVLTAKKILRQLSTAHLAESLGEHRYTAHDLLRQYGAELAIAAGDDISGGLARLREWYVGVGRQAAEVLSPSVLMLPCEATLPDASRPPLEDPRQALEWYSVEHRNIAALIQHAVRDADPLAYRLCEAWRLYAFRANDFASLRDGALAGLEVACAREDARAEGVMSYLLSMYAQIIGQRAEANEWLTRTLRAARRANDLNLATTSHASAANLWQRAGAPQKALWHCRRAMEIRPQLSQRQRMIVWNTMGIAYRESGELSKSAAILRRHVAALRGETGHKLSPTLGELAATYLQQGEYAVAWRCAESAYRLALTAGGISEQLSHVDTLAALYLRCGYPALAHKCANEALRVAESKTDLLIQPALWTTLAFCRMDEPESAVLAAERAVSLSRELELPWQEIYALITSAVVRQHRGELAAAGDLTEEARGLAASRGYQVLHGWAHLTAAEVAADRNDSAAVLDMARQAWTMHRAIGHRPGEAVASKLLAKLTGDDTLGGRAERIAAQSQCQLPVIEAAFTD